MPIKEEDTDLNKVAAENQSQKTSNGAAIHDATFVKPDAPTHCGIGEGFFAIAQLVTIVIFAVGTQYGDGVNVTTPNSLDVKFKDGVQQGYGAFQDLHVMIFLGFAFLMTFIRQAQLSTICYNWIISVWAMQWAILSVGFWNQIIISEGEVELKKLDIDLSSMVTGDFGAAAAMITFGCVLGKCNLQQLFFLIFWEMIWYGLNGAIGFNLIKATDMGGSMFIHTFGAYYGLAATYFFQGKRAEASKNMKSDYNSEVTALIGTLFLWMYYPSFNGALCTDGVQQQRVFVNTIMAMCGGTMGATSVSRIMFGKLEMEIMLNAALGGGVGIGTSSDIIVSPYASLLIGFFGGALSAWSFKKLGPFLQEKIGLQDTCGVHSLHGLPGIYGGTVSMVAIALSSGKGFDDYFPRSEEGIGAQVASQFFGLILTIAVSIFAGATGGLICSMKCFNPVSALFKDDDHIEEATGKYPKKFLMDTDETYPIAAIDAAE